MTRKRIERRYLVVKLADVDRYLTASDRHAIHTFTGVIERKRKEEGRTALTGIYVDKEFPIYDQVEALTLHWLNGDPGEPQIEYIRRIETRLRIVEAELAYQREENVRLCCELESKK
jgi:hypothetical protein